PGQGRLPLRGPPHRAETRQGRRRGHADRLRRHAALHRRLRPGQAHGRHPAAPLPAVGHRRAGRHRRHDPGLLGPVLTPAAAVHPAAQPRAGPRGAGRGAGHPRRARPAQRCADHAGAAQPVREPHGQHVARGRLVLLDGLDQSRRRHLPHEHRGGRPLPLPGRGRSLPRAHADQRLQPEPAGHRSPRLGRPAGRARRRRLRRLSRARMPPARRARDRSSPDSRLHQEIPMILRDALRVLIANWDGSYTVPSRTLYPHQWSWDSAFIAIGHARWSPRRARTQLLRLFRAQWEAGGVPHIVFNPAVPDAGYLPGPEFGATRSPSGYATSGIVQPPVHAMAAWRAHLAEPDHGFLARIYPRLVAQQEFLRTQRRGIDGLISIVHPWESGMDNSPCWDLPLNAVEPMPDGVCRRDLAHISPAERPTDRDYERYIALARAYRDTGYRGTCAFQVEDPLFNTAYGMA